MLTAKRSAACGQHSLKLGATVACIPRQKAFVFILLDSGRLSVTYALLVIGRLNDSAHSSMVRTVFVYVSAKKLRSKPDPRETEDMNVIG